MNEKFEKLNKKQQQKVNKLVLTVHRRDNEDMNKLHTEAIRINDCFKEARKRKLATRKEFNAFKRTENTNRNMSTFCKSYKTTSQAFRIDEALTEYHSMKELLALETLSDCREARVKSHISFLQHEFRHSCKLVYSEDKKKFKFELI